MTVANGCVRGLTLHFATIHASSLKILSVAPLPLRTFRLSSLSTTENPTHDSHLREHSLLSLFKSCSNMADLKQIHSQLIQTGFDQHIYVVGRIITFCSVSDYGSMDYAVSVFEQIKYPDGFLWNTMIRGFGKNNRPEEALEFYKRMLDKGEVADNFTFSFLLKICGQLSAVQLGMQIHCCTLKHGLDSHVFVRNTLIHMYGIFKDIATARLLFEEIPSSDLVAWNTIIDAYVHCQLFEEALKVFSRMQRNGVEPDDATLVVVLSACSNLGDLDFGSRVHSQIDDTGLDQIVSVSNSLIDMYAKCGAINEARRVFYLMKKTNIVSWNSMIVGLAMHGHAGEALQLFSRMIKLKCEVPNDVTFLGVLCACSHAGLVDEGRRYFNCMTVDYGIRPTIKHYGCMVDLLGRAGLVGKAYELIRKMPIECNAIVWRTLLGACRVHGNIELGELVRRHLLELEPHHSGDYVLLSNMYATAGLWNDMVKERGTMRDMRVQKPEPGNSLVDVILPCS